MQPLFCSTRVIGHHPASPWPAQAIVPKSSMPAVGVPKRQRALRRLVGIGVPLIWTAATIQRAAIPCTPEESPPIIPTGVRLPSDSTRNPLTVPLPALRV